MTGSLVAARDVLPGWQTLLEAAAALVLACPIDLVADFIPVLGYADDAVIVALAGRSVVRRAGTGALERHWPGTLDGLSAVKGLAGVGTPS